MSNAIGLRFKLFVGVAVGMRRWGRRLQGINGLLFSSSLFYTFCVIGAETRMNILLFAMSILPFLEERDGGSIYRLILTTSILKCSKQTHFYSFKM